LDQTCTVAERSVFNEELDFSSSSTDQQRLDNIDSFLQNLGLIGLESKKRKQSLTGEMIEIDDLNLGTDLWHQHYFGAKDFKNLESFTPYNRSSSFYSSLPFTQYFQAIEARELVEKGRSWPYGGLDDAHNLDVILDVIGQRAIADSGFNPGFFNSRVQKNHYSLSCSQDFLKSWGQDISDLLTIQHDDVVPFEMSQPASPFAPYAGRWANQISSGKNDAIPVAGYGLYHAKSVISKGQYSWSQSLPSAIETQLRGNVLDTQFPPLYSPSLNKLYAIEALAQAVVELEILYPQDMGSIMMGLCEGQFVDNVDLSFCHSSEGLAYTKGEDILDEIKYSLNPYMLNDRIAPLEVPLLMQIIYPSDEIETNWPLLGRLWNLPMTQKLFDSLTPEHRDALFTEWDFISDKMSKAPSLASLRLSYLLMKRELKKKSLDPQNSAACIEGASEVLDSLGHSLGIDGPIAPDHFQRHLSKEDKIAVYKAIEDKIDGQNLHAFKLKDGMNQSFYEKFYQVARSSLLDVSKIQEVASSVGVESFHPLLQDQITTLSQSADNRLAALALATSRARDRDEVSALIEDFHKSYGHYPQRTLRAGALVDQEAKAIIMRQLVINLSKLKVHDVKQSISHLCQMRADYRYKKIPVLSLIPIVKSMTTWTTNQESTVALYVATSAMQKELIQDNALPENLNAIFDSMGGIEAQGAGRGMLAGLVAGFSSSVMLFGCSSLPIACALFYSLGLGAVAYATNLQSDAYFLAWKDHDTRANLKDQMRSYIAHGLSDPKELKRLNKGYFDVAIEVISFLPIVGPTGNILFFGGRVATTSVVPIALALKSASRFAYRRTSKTLISQVGSGGRLPLRGQLAADAKRSFQRFLKVRALAKEEAPSMAQIAAEYQLYLSRNTLAHTQRAHRRRTLEEELESLSSLRESGAISTGSYWWRRFTLKAQEDLGSIVRLESPEINETPEMIRERFIYSVYERFQGSGRKFAFHLNGAFGNLDPIRRGTRALFRTTRQRAQERIKKSDLYLSEEDIGMMKKVFGNNWAKYRRWRSRKAVASYESRDFARSVKNLEGDEFRQWLGDNYDKLFVYGLEKPMLKSELPLFMFFQGSPSMRRGIPGTRWLLNGIYLNRAARSRDILLRAAYRAQANRYFGKKSTLSAIEYNQKDALREVFWMIRSKAAELKAQGKNTVADFDRFEKDFAEEIWKQMDAGKLKCPPEIQSAKDIRLIVFEPTDAHEIALSDELWRSIDQEWLTQESELFHWVSSAMDELVHSSHVTRYGEIDEAIYYGKILLLKKGAREIDFI
jgi:hypothetical protein